MIYILMMLWQHAGSSQNEILSFRLNKAKYLVLSETHASPTFITSPLKHPVQLQMVIFDFKEEETGTDHVAVATSECVPSGIFLRVQHPCLVSIALLHFRRRYSHYSTCTTDDVISRLNLHNGKT